MSAKPDEISYRSTIPGLVLSEEEKEAELNHQRMTSYQAYINGFISAQVVKGKIDLLESLGADVDAIRRSYRDGEMIRPEDWHV